MPEPRWLAWAGGPHGRSGRAPERGLDRLLHGVPPVVVAAVVVLGLALLRLQGCVTTGWQGRSADARMCASTLVASTTEAGLGGGLPAYLSGGLRLDEAPLSGAALALVGGVSGTPRGLLAQRTAVLLWCALAVVVLILLARAMRDVPGADVTQVLLSPVLVLTVLLGPELLGAGVATLGLLAWLAGRPLVAGLLLGAGAWSGLPGLAVLAVVAALALVEGAAIRASVGRRPLGWLAAGVLATSLSLLAAFSRAPEALVHPVTTWWSTPAGPGSLWDLPTLAGRPLPAGLTTALSVAGWVVAAGLVARAVAAPWPVLDPRRQLPALVLLVVAVVLATTPSLPLSASLWLVPLVALAGLRWRDHLLWAGAEAVHFVAFWLHRSAAFDPNHGLPHGWYAVATVVRVAAIAWLAACARRRATAD
ncbi:MAG: hypothetical protein U0Q08_12865 [Dermatophilaceae bacterium]